MTTLLPDEVHIWTALVPSTISPKMADRLSAGERDRARRFRFHEDQLRYIFAHSVLRQVLGQYLDCPPIEIKFDANPFGKPFVVRTSAIRPPEFNVSHASKAILIGVCAGRIGVDIEEIRRIDDLLSIAKSQFGPWEQSFLFAQALERREEVFFRCWTRKEAYVKALGEGLSIPLTSFDTLSESAVMRPLQVIDLDVPKGYAGAVALETDFHRFHYFEWN